MSSDTTMNDTESLEKGDTLERLDIDLKGDKEDVESSTDAAANEKATASNATFPEGGVRAYAALAGSFATFFATFGMSNCYGVIQVELQHGLLSSYTPSAISAIGSLHLFMLFGSGLYAGRLFDRGYFQYQLAVGSVLWVLGVFMLSLSKEYYQVLLSYSVLMGVGVGALFAPSLSNIGTYFLRRRGIASGVLASGAALGAVIFPILLNHLFPKIGFGPTVRAAGYLMLGLLAFANAVTRPRKLPPKVPEPAFPLIKLFMSQPTTWCVSLGAFFSMMGLFLPIFYVNSYATDNRLGDVPAKYSLTILNSTGVIARIVAGMLGDIFGIINTLAVMSLVNSVLVFCLIAGRNFAGVISFDVLYGLTSAFQVSLMVPGLMCLARGPHELGTRSGCGLIFVALATGAGGPIAGALLSAAGRQPSSYWAPFLFGGLSWICGAGFYSVLRFVLCRRKGTWKV